MTLFRMGWGWLFILLTFCGTYYSVSISRVRRRARSDIQRELVKTRLTSPDEHESAEWINNFLDRFWLSWPDALDDDLTSCCGFFNADFPGTAFGLGALGGGVVWLRLRPLDVLSCCLCRDLPDDEE